MNPKLIGTRNDKGLLVSKIDHHSANPMKTQPHHNTLSILTLCAFSELSGFELAAQLPDPGMDADPKNTAVLITDPQNDFLSPGGVTWGVVGESIQENNTVENIDRLMSTAKENGYAWHSAAGDHQSGQLGHRSTSSRS